MRKNKAKFHTHPAYQSKSKTKLKTKDPADNKIWQNPTV